MKTFRIDQKGHLELDRSRRRIELAQRNRQNNGLIVGGGVLVGLSAQLVEKLALAFFATSWLPGSWLVILVAGTGLTLVGNSLLKDYQLQVIDQIYHNEIARIDE